MTTPSQPAANLLSPGPAVEDGQRAKDPAVPATAARQAREPGYTRTGQQDTDANLQDEVTRYAILPAA